VSPESCVDRQLLTRESIVVGVTYDQTSSQWANDISEAKSAGIDGFALNVGNDSSTDEQLGLVSDAASAAGSFSLFLSFDMQASSWSVAQVESFINTYKEKASQYRVNGLPFVSTFEGLTGTAGPR
jgi:glucan endo-1,3-alpha-glucosidase